jgi:hypothetical protein
MANPSEDLRRRQAYEDYKRLPLLGMKQNPNQLYLWYIQRLHDDPSDRPNIPTTNRATVYEWYKQDRWEEKVALEGIAILDRSAATFADLRQRGYDQLNMLIIDAVAGLEKLIKPKAGTRIDPKVQLEAIKTLLDRVGISAEKAQQNRHVVGTPQDTPIEKEVPDFEGDPDQLYAFLSEQSREG